MPPIFELVHKDVCGRIGRLETSHGIVETPMVMPVVNPSIRTIEPWELKNFGAEIIMANSYIIYRRPEFKARALSEGLHSLIGFDGPIMTDSGSYQLSVYGDVEVNNKEIVQFQQEIGSDIGVPLDIPTPPDVSHERAQAELEITIERAKEALEVKGEMLLAGPVQGSTFQDLRERAARELSHMDFDIFPLGAVVPLMESYRFSDLVDVIVASKKGLMPSSPVHLFGAGHPMMFALAVALGCDLFDSAAYALYAKEGRYITPSGTYLLGELEYLPCSCPICSSYSARGIKDSEDKVALIARHNLYTTFGEIRLIKQSIRDGSLWELVEQRCRSHPALLSGLKRVTTYMDWIERYSPISRSTFFYTGPESSRRVEVIRYANRMSRLKLKGRVLIRSRKSKIFSASRQLNVNGSSVPNPKGLRTPVKCCDSVATPVNSFELTRSPISRDDGVGTPGKSDVLSYASKKTSIEGFDHVLELKAPFGAFPVELKETYPFNAEVSEPDWEGISSALKNTLKLIELNPKAEYTFFYDDAWEHPLIEEIKKKVACWKKLP